MSEPNQSILASIRSLLMLFEDVTDIVSDRITPNQFAPDGNQQRPSIMLEMQAAPITGTLGHESHLVSGQLVITIRSKDDLLNDAIAESIRTQNTTPGTGLDGYSGTAGGGNVLWCERTDFSQDIVFDDDGDETDLYDSIQIYDLKFQIHG